MAGTLTISTLSDGTNSTSATNCIQGSAKAWVNFNGTGTVAIRASYNVSSITDQGTGDYQINFTNALADANYAVTATGSNGSGDGLIAWVANNQTTPTTSLVRVRFANFSGTATDASFQSVVIFD
jgi:hypothetical protein